MLNMTRNTHKRCFPYRPHDYMYDPIFTVSGPVDHYKAAIVAKMSSVKFQICPIFPNMFSDLPNHPRVQLVQRRQKQVQSYREREEASRKSDAAVRKSVDVRGVDRAKFFCPIINLPPENFKDVSDTMPHFTIEPVIRRFESARRSEKNLEGEVIITKDMEVQTMYRESEAQTQPWEPPYKVIGEGDPEILKLDFLKWGSGLPSGMHEIWLIERARMKRAWEKTVQPGINDENSLQKFRDYIEALERDEWAFREKEIKEIQELRLHLLEEMLAEIHEKSHSRNDEKLMKIIERKQKEKEEKLRKIRHKAARELRKLELEEKGVSRRYKSCDIIEEHASKKSELYGPMIRHGEHPKRWHFVIDEKLKKYKEQFIGVEHFSTLPRWLHQATDLKGLERSTPQSKVPQLCIRETKWTAPVLKQLHEELQNLRKETQREPCYLRIRNQKPVQEVPTPEVEGVDVVQEDQYQAIVFLQSLIKGRAIQMMVYEGRDTCKELILELKNSIGLLKKDKELRSKDKVKVRAQQREETIQSVMVSRLQGTLGKLQGQVVGSLLDFLNKELRRLLEERKAHAMCWINERERNIREAAEAGRRQKEIRRRKEHDEIFRQLVKVTQESVDLYLQDIITEGIEFASTEEAKDYVLNLAEKVEKEVNMIDKIYAMKGVGAQEELISDLVHHFVLPEVEKQTIRKNMADKQRQNLKSIHEAVYSQFEGLPKVGKDTSFSVNSSLPTVDGVRYSISMGYADSIPHGTVDSSLKPNASVEHQNIVSDEQEHIDPDMIEKYLNMLAAQDQTQDETQIQEIYMNYPGYTRYNTFQNDLDTIPETEHETSTNITSTDSTSETPLYPSGVEE
ncbi:cilia- and flagella-associated protein 91-like [Sitophilus oryzae]|uniref:Cilia- and flagella-associated protein 91 n=1 Tax=Sitophilus oryzae TaxID=7048 RepID=A0A6J2XFP2_SITOR|nr:cilia- and flagella-associated protein 91-like [Sitophilus oryzae]